VKHIPDIGKMVSDTPRTEAEVNRPHGPLDGIVTVDADFAAQLERELNAANERIRLLIAERDTARRQADQHYKLREEFRELLGTDDVEQGVAVVRGLKDRIKRLEAVTNDPHALWANWLRGTVPLPAGIGDVRQYQDYISLLEEAGDRAIGISYYPHRESVWNKAKEAKP